MSLIEFTFDVSLALSSIFEFEWFDSSRFLLLIYFRELVDYGIDFWLFFDSSFWDILDYFKSSWDFLESN